MLIEQLHDLYTLPHIIRVIKAKRMKWPGHLESNGEKRNASRVVATEI